MCHLVEDSSVAVQKMAYQLLRVASQKRTEYFVIEAGVDTEAAVNAVLPTELLDILQRDMQFNRDSEVDDDPYNYQGQNIFGYLLGWMLVFDLFQDAVSINFIFSSPELFVHENSDSVILVFQSEIELYRTTQGFEFDIGLFYSVLPRLVTPQSRWPRESVQTGSLGGGQVLR